MANIDIVIPTFNNLGLLKKNLPTIIKHSPEANSIIVTDDASNDNTVEFIKKNFPKIKVYQQQVNQRFPKNVNFGVSKSKADYIVLLNSDVVPEKNYLKNSLKHFQNKDVFAVTFREQEHSWPQVVWQGSLEFTNGKDKSTPRYVAWPSGGSSIISRSHWDTLGGFNPIYTPGYWEDIDLGWRANKQGWLTVWEPTAKVSHQSQSTYDTLEQHSLNLTKQRNQILFHLLNITDPGKRIQFFTKTFIHTLSHPGYLKVLARVLTAIPRLNKPLKPILTDQEVFSRINQPIT